MVTVCLAALTITKRGSQLTPYPPLPVLQPPTLRKPYVDKAGNLVGRPIAWYGQVGMRPIEPVATPEGVVGKATLASVEKARTGVEAVLDYTERLVNDIMESYPAGELPPADQITQRTKEELEAVLKQPLTPGWKSIYTIAYPM